MYSTTIIKILESLFARYGNPITLVSDNQSSFISKEIEEFLRTKGIKHLTISPYVAATNGQAERMVGALKTCLRTLSNQGSAYEKLQKFLLAYRRAPHAVTGVSPASLF